MLGLSLLPASVTAETTLSFSPLPGSRVERQVLSWRELRDKGVVKQNYDYSCGSGALATLMRLGFGDEVSEEEIIFLLIQDKTAAELEEIEKKGYSLLDLKQVAEKKGYIAVMYKLQIKHLYQLKGPVLIYLEPEGQRHFSVLKEARGDRVYLADPAKGNIRIGLYRFQKEWPGIILAIDKVHH